MQRLDGAGERRALRRGQFQHFAAGTFNRLARDLVGYSVLQMVIHIPIVFFLCWLFAQYIPFVPPMK